MRIYRWGHGSGDHVEISLQELEPFRRELERNVGESLEERTAFAATTVYAAAFGVYVSDPKAWEWFLSKFGFQRVIQGNVEIYLRRALLAAWVEERGGKMPEPIYPPIEAKYLFDLEYPDDSVADVLKWAKSRFRG